MSDPINPLNPLTAAETTATTAAQPQLSEADQQAVDALVEAQFNPERIGDAHSEHSEHDQQRLRQAERIFKLLDLYPAEVDEQNLDTLMDATMARIDQHEAQRSQRMQLATAQAEQAERRRAWRMPDVVSVAAVLLLVAAVAWPLLFGGSQQATISYNTDRPANTQDAWDRGARTGLPLQGDEGFIFTTWDALSELILGPRAPQRELRVDSSTLLPGYDPADPIRVEIGSSHQDSQPVRMRWLFQGKQAFLEVAHPDWDVRFYIPAEILREARPGSRLFAGPDGVVRWIQHPIDAGRHLRMGLPIPWPGRSQPLPIY